MGNPRDMTTETSEPRPPRKRLHNVLREAWRIAKPYWFSEEKWSGIALLAVVVVLNLATVGLDVRFNYWRNTFYNTVQNLDESGFFSQIWVFFGLAMVWLTLIYALVGTVLAVRIGRPLVGLNFDQQRFEADFRYSLVRLREHTESVAFYGGEPREYESFGRRFADVFLNRIAIMWRTLKLSAFHNGVGQATAVFPYLVQAPRFFAKEIQLGDLMQTREPFRNVR